MLPGVADGSEEDLTRLLGRMNDGDEAAREAVYRLVYGELRKIARAARRGRGNAVTTTALVHEAYLKLADRDVDWKNRRHFFATAALAMRSILVDHVRGRTRKKRQRPDEGLEAVARSFEARSADLLDLDRALTDLAANDAEAARVVELRFFAGLTVAETARVLGRSPRTVERDWTFARSWLADVLGAERGGADPDVSGGPSKGT